LFLRAKQIKKSGELEINIVFILGTRPEAIKLAPVILEAKKFENFNVEVVLSSQHPDMCIQTLSVFGVEPTQILDCFRKDQSLVSFSSLLLSQLSKLDLDWQHSIVVVQGDTSTATIAAYAGFLLGSRVAHIEAGLRTFNRDPFPEEMNRRLISRLADFHFCPTNANADNLKNEGVKDSQIFVVGNSVIDAIQHFNVENREENEKKTILVTLHRRENQDGIIATTTRIIDELANQFAFEFNWKFIKHPNPNAQAGYDSKFMSNRNIQILDPLGYPEVLDEMSRTYLLITDSGGFQEESTYLGIPTLILRKYTERPEAILAGPCRLVEDPSSQLSQMVTEILTTKSLHKRMSQSSNVFGDGTTSQKIMQTFESLL
jgi:UDP-N-acetylglucosamine 2-epimerase (non-hydrolysing)